MHTKQWSELSARLGRNDMPYVLFTNLYYMTVEDVAVALEQSWTMAEWPCRLIEPDLWLEAFDLVLDEYNAYVTDNGVLESWDTLPEKVTLYRGAFKDDIEGMSWTGSLSVAKWFAHRWALAGKDGVVVTTTVPRSAILAHFTDRNEDEYVINIRYHEYPIELVDESEKATAE